MTTSSDLLKLAELRERATAGPWERRDTHIGPDKYHASTEIVGRVQPGASTPVCRLSSGFVWFEGDCDYITACGNLTPARLRELAAMEEALQRIRDWPENSASGCVQIAREALTTKGTK